MRRELTHSRGFSALTRIEREKPALKLLYSVVLTTLEIKESPFAAWGPKET